MKKFLNRILNNKKTSGGVLGTLIAAVTGIWGFDLPADTVSMIALGITSLIGFLAKD